jgi:hypothetical protein
MVKRQQSDECVVTSLKGADHAIVKNHEATIEDLAVPRIGTTRLKAR